MADSTNHRTSTGRWVRWWRGLFSTLKIYLVPVGNWWCGGIEPLQSDERRGAGLVLVLPGIEGRSTLNLDIARGLADAGLPYSIELHDWTTGRTFFSLYHLRSNHWHALQAARLAQRIRDYQDEFPGRPVVLVGHSGGAAITLEALPLLKDRQITSAVMLAIAVSPGYDLRAALRRTRQGIWSFHSPLDWLQLGLGTLLVGTFDGKHSISAGMFGFPPIEPTSEDAAGDDLPPLRQIGYRWSLLRQWNFGGHHGWSNRVFAAESLAPAVQQACEADANEDDARRC